MIAYGWRVVATITLQLYLVINTLLRNNKLLGDFL